MMRARLGTGVRLFAALLLPIAVLLSHRNLPVVYIFIGLAGLLFLPQIRIERWAWPALGLVIYAALTSLWSPYGEPWNWVASLTTLALFVMLSTVSDDRLSFRVFFWAAVISLLLLSLEAATGGWLRDVTPPVSRPDKDDVATARGVSIGIYLLPPILYVTLRRKWWILSSVMTIGLFWGAIRFDVSANVLALVAALTAAAMAWFRPKLTFWLLGIGAIALFVICPIGAALLPDVETMLSWEEGPASWRSRLIIWKTICSETWVMDAPGFLFGHGVESARVLGERLGFVDVPGALEPMMIIPTHPHNVFLQTWYDLGFIGVAGSMFAIYAGTQALVQKVTTRPMAAAIAALIGSTLVFAGVDASLWTIWRVAAPLLAAWLLVSATKQ